MHTVPDHRPTLLPVRTASLQHRCCRHDDAVPAEFAVIAAEVLDCFATAFYASPVKLRDAGGLCFECALVLDEEDATLRLRLRCSVEHGDGSLHPVEIKTPAVLYIMGALRCASVYKQIELSPIVCSDDLTCEFMAGYPGKLSVRDMPGIGETMPDGETCWPSTLMHAPLPSARLSLHARSIVHWLRSGATAKVH